MLYRVFADLVVVVHLSFVLFAVLGGFLVLRWLRCAWIHVPCVVWAALISFAGWVCPLTPLENWLLERGPVLYPDAAVLTRPVQIILGFLLLGLNLGIYGLVLRRIVKRVGLEKFDS